MKPKALLKQIFGRKKRKVRETVKPLDEISKAALQRCISEYSTGRFKLKRCELTVSTRGSKIHHDFPLQKKLRSMSLTITHRPTGVHMNGYVKYGRYSKREMRKIKEEMIERYFSSIEFFVNQRLKSCMTKQFGPIPKKGEYD